MSDPTSSMNLSIQNPQSTQSMSGGIIGFGLGQWVAENKNKIIAGLLIMLVVFIFLKLLKQISDAETVEANASIIGAAAAYTNSIRHKKCKGRGGCSRKCPFVTEDDPRVVMCKQADAIEQLNDLIRQGLDEDRMALETSISRLSAGAQESVVNELKEVQETKLRCASQIATIAATARSLDSKYGSSSTVTVDVVNAKNRISAMEAAASICKNVYLASVVRATSCVMDARVHDIPEMDHTRINSYDTKAVESQINATSIKETYKTLSSLIAESTVPDSYGAIFSDLKSDTISSDRIIAAVAAMINFAKDSHLSVASIIGKFEIIVEIYENMMRKLDAFSNDLPGTMNSEQISKFIDDDDYSSAVIRTALEPEIVSNHKKFAKERSTFDSGGGVPSVRDDDNDVVSWVGLFGRPTYRHSDGTSADKSSEPLRAIPSDVPENLMRKNTPRLSFA